MLVLVLIPSCIIVSIPFKANFNLGNLLSPIKYRRNLNFLTGKFVPFQIVLIHLCYKLPIFLSQTYDFNQPANKALASFLYHL